MRFGGLGFCNSDFDGAIGSQLDTPDVQANRSDRCECPLEFGGFDAPTTGTHGNVLVASIDNPTRLPPQRQSLGGFAQFEDDCPAPG